MNLDFPVDQEAWKIGHDATGRLTIAFIYRNRISPEEILFPCRLVVLGLSWILSFCIFFWAKRLWGTSSGIWSVLLYLLCPAVIAYSGIAMIEIGITLFFFWAVIALWWFMQKPIFKRLTVLGLATGGALAAKITGVVLFPIQLGIFFYKERRLSLKMIQWFAWIGLIACVVIAMSYRFIEVLRYTDVFRWAFSMVLGPRAWRAGFIVAIKNSELLAEMVSFPIQIYAPWSNSTYVNPIDMDREFFVVTVDALHEADPSEVHFFSWFKNLKPYAVLGYSIYIYDITHDPRPHFLMASRYKEKAEKSPNLAVLAEREYQRAWFIKRS
jgi:hypothetical protein